MKFITYIEDTHTHIYIHIYMYLSTMDGRVKWKYIVVRVLYYLRSGVTLFERRIY